MSVSFIPAGYHTLTPYLIVKGAGAAIEFYKNVFGAVEIMRMAGPNGCIMHAEIKIGDSIIMLADEAPERGCSSPLTIGGSPIGMCLYFPDVDARFEAAVSNGAKVEKPLMDQFYGDRSGSIVDPFGHKWTIATHIEDVSPEEMDRRCQEVMKKFAAA
jgi:PhnB protein